jgi:hypothetical protein
MKERIRSIIVFFFVLFGGIFFLKTSFHGLILQKGLDYKSEALEAAFIAIFIAVLLVTVGGYTFQMKKR